MTGPETIPTNVAGDSANVGVQAGVVHGDITSYTISPDPSPEEKFELGMHYLDGGMRQKAWHLISEAVAADYRTGKACFYWLLALVSGRTRNELSGEDAEMLRTRRDRLRLTGDDEWAAGVRAIHRLLDFAEKPQGDIGVVLGSFEGLGDAQRARILRHLALFLDGPLKDQIWDRALKKAQDEQTNKWRKERVWKFFEPDPARPRPRNVKEVEIPLSTRLQRVAGSIALAVAAAHIGYLLLRAGQDDAILAYLLSVTGGYLTARDGVEWHSRTVRLQEKEAEHAQPSRRGSNAPSGGFADNVDQLFEHYFGSSVPDGVDRQFWLAQTAGIRKSIRDELVDVYREQRTGADSLEWLVRHRVSDVRTRWNDGTLWAYRQELATPLPVKARAILGTAALAVGGIWAAAGAAHAGPLNTIGSMVIALFAGYVAVRAQAYVVLENLRHKADKAESERIREGSEVAFSNWMEELADKPTDAEMAAWLDCDRKVLLEEALRHYKLAMSSVIAHALVETPAASTTRARVRGGPWRYRRYRFLLFLLTADGARQLAVELDFDQGTFHGRQWTNYRYDAVAAVHVTQADDYERTMELALVDGQKFDIRATGLGMEQLLEDEIPGVVFGATLDSTGLHRTLHVLEGIAAEGKEWISRGTRHRDERTRNLNAVVNEQAS